MTDTHIANGAAPSAARRTFRLPDLGEGLTEAELVSWSVTPGDVVSLNQPLGEVETAKAVVELPSPYAGSVAELLAEPGDTVTVGSPLVIVTVDDPDGAPPEEVSDDSLHETSAENAATPPTLVGSGPRPPRSTRRTASRRRILAEAPAPSSTVGSHERPPAKPTARKRARELGIALDQVEGTGFRGAITSDDVAAHADLVDPTTDSDRRIPVQGIRRRTAQAVTAALTVPQVTEFLTVDVTASMELLDDLRANPRFRDCHPTPMLLVAQALLNALRESPLLNSSWDEQAQEIVVHHRVNLGLAVAGTRGLTVPNVTDAGSLGLHELCRRLGELVDSARAGTSTPTELTGGTITITNIGVFGVDTGTPILTPGEAAILAVGAIGARPWVHQGDVAVRTVTTLALTFDHRIVDGAEASRFLTAIGAVLTNPLLLGDRS